MGGNDVVPLTLVATCFYEGLRVVPWTLTFRSLWIVRYWLFRTVLGAGDVDASVDNFGEEVPKCHGL